MKILITGSHFTPAQAVIEELKKDPKIEIVYIGRKHTLEGDRSQSVESRVLPSIGVRFIPITAGRIQRAWTRYTIPSLLKIPLGFIQSLYLMARESPDATLSFGGYVSVPIVIASWLFSIPIIVHEQTLVMGFANTVSSWFADKIALTFPKDELVKGRKYIVTGNPMRKSLLHSGERVSAEIKGFLQERDREQKPLLLVTGGNQGSHIINKIIEENLEELLKVVFIVHQTGESKYNDFERLEEKKRTLKLGLRYFPEKWIDSDEFGWLLRQTDFVVSRAGANTLLELAYFGIPAIVIPLPYIYKDEQTKNALYFEKVGLVKLLPQSKLSGQTFLKEVKSMLTNLDELREKAKEAKKIIKLDAAKRLSLETKLLAAKER